MRSQFDPQLSLAYDRAVLRVEGSRGLTRWFWRLWKRWIERRIPSRS